MAAIVLSDGRTLAYETMGDPDGNVVVALHGTPGSWRQLAALDGPARQQGVAVIAPDRPGFGGSSHDRSRTIASGARDVGELLARLDVDRCTVAGFSGGGPTALACGVLLADRVRAVSTIGGVAPLEPRDPSLPPDRLVTRTARRSELATRALFSVIVAMGRRRPEATLERFASLLAESDARLLSSQSSVRDALIDDLRHPSSTTARASARDFRLFTQRWDIDLTATSVPIEVWHGTEDRNVPVAHASVIARRSPSSRLHLVDGGGHMLLSHLTEILDSLRDGS